MFGSPTPRRPQNRPRHLPPQSVSDEIPPTYPFCEFWKPVSAGEIFWSCITLLMISLLEGFMSGLRGRFEAYWASRCGSIHLSWVRVLNECQRGSTKLFRIPSLRIKIYSALDLNQLGAQKCRNVSSSHRLCRLVIASVVSSTPHTHCSTILRC